jgi:hypothetical protein
MAGLQRESMDLHLLGYLDPGNQDVLRIRCSARDDVCCVAHMHPACGISGR